MFELIVVVDVLINWVLVSTAYSRTQQKLPVSPASFYFVVQMSGP